MGRYIIILFLALGFIHPSCTSQPHFGDDRLVVQSTIELQKVQGRIDHMDVNLKQGLIYIAALGNNSLEIIDIHNSKHVHSITGLHEPQGVAYIPQHREIFVANGGDGTCAFYNAESFEKTATIKLSSDADDVRYDSASGRIYVGYGSGGIAIIDANHHQQTGNILLPAHPEGFQLDKSLNRIFVNVPDEGIIAVADLNTEKLTSQWKTEASANFPMAIDTAHHRIFIGYRRPALFTVVDERTGKTLGSYKTVSDMDDLYFDAETNQILVSGGGGSVQLFTEKNGSFTQTASIPTRKGARTSLLIPSLSLFVLAARPSGAKAAAISIYKISKP